MTRTLGLISGYIFGQYILPGRGLTKFYMALISCTNSTAFQLLLIQTLKETLGLMKPLVPDLQFQLTIEDRGIYYIMLTSAVSTIFLWSFAYLYFS